jgi:hypothetical protein
MLLFVQLRVRDEERTQVARAIREARIYACAYRRMNPTYHLSLAIKRAGRGYRTTVFHYDRYTGGKCTVSVGWH